MQFRINDFFCSQLKQKCFSTSNEMSMSTFYNCVFYVFVHSGHLKTVRRQVQRPESSSDEAILQRRQPDRYTTLKRGAVIGQTSAVGFQKPSSPTASPGHKHIVPHSQQIHTRQPSGCRATWTNSYLHHSLTAA